MHITLNLFPIIKSCQAAHFSCYKIQLFHLKLTLGLLTDVKIHAHFKSLLNSSEFRFSGNILSLVLFSTLLKLACLHFQSPSEPFSCYLSAKQVLLAYDPAPNCQPPLFSAHSTEFPKCSKRKKWNSDFNFSDQSKNALSVLPSIPFSSLPISNTLSISLILL